MHKLAVSLREQIECSDVSRAHDSEVAAVQSRDLGQSESLGCRHQRSVHSAQRQITIAPDQLGYPKPVFAGHALTDQVARREVTKETDFCFDTEASRQQVGHLGDYQYGHQKRAGVRFQQLEALLVMIVVGVDIGVKRSGIDQDGYRATSSRRISSILTETS
jgi:hypothetical protein